MSRPRITRQSLLRVAVFNGLWMAAAGCVLADSTITFEEAIAQPKAVVSQYCNQASTNRGVEFANMARVFTPTVTTSSPSHAIYNDFGQEFDETRSLDIAFTTGQSRVGMKVGVDGSTKFPVTAVLYAYSSKTPGTGFITSATAYLGYGPVKITKDLSVTSVRGDIRSVRIAFTGPSSGNFAIEVIDDLVFSNIGPSCLTDNAPPTVQITAPAADGKPVYPDTHLAFIAKDSESGVAEIKVSLLDSRGTIIESFFTCGGLGAPGCAIPSNILSYNFLTHLPDNTRKIRVEAKDYALRTGKAERLIDFRPLGPNMNIYVQGMEITQGIQNWVPVDSRTRGTSPVATFSYPGAPTAVPLVAGRTTAVRVYAGVEGIASDRQVDLVRATLHAYTDPSYSNPHPGYRSVTPVKGQWLTLRPTDTFDSRRRNLDRSFTFILPRSWTQAKTIYLEAEIKLSNPTLECKGCVDAANRIRISGVTFNSVPDFSDLIRLIIVNHRLGKATTSPTAARLMANLNLIRRTYPIDETTVPTTADGTMTYVDDATRSLKKRCSHLFNTVKSTYSSAKSSAQAKTGNSMVYCGLIPGSYPCAGQGNGTKSGGGFCYGRVSATDGAAHEIGHGFGLLHAGPPPGHTAECNNGWCDNDWPWLHGTINAYGFDILSQTVISPGTTESDFHDFMSYGGPNMWISGRNWIRLYNTFTKKNLSYPKKGSSAELTIPPRDPSPAGLPARSGDPFRRSAGAARITKMALASFSPAAHQARSSDATRSARTDLLIRGTLDPFSGWRLLPVYELPAQGPRVDGGGRGEYQVELLNDTGRVVHQRRFSIPTAHIDLGWGELATPPPFFEMTLAEVESTSVIVLRGPGGEELARRARSEHRPSVEIDSPDDRGFLGANASPIIRWRASDHDSGEPLHYLVQYSPGRGRQSREVLFQTLAIDVVESWLDVNLADLPGGEGARVRVLATDGFNTGMATSRSFYIEDTPPTVDILSPTQSVTIRRGEWIVLRGAGSDLEDGNLPSGQLVWNSSLDGMLGEGRGLDLESLSVGVHEIVLRGWDSTRQSDEATVVIEVQEGINVQPIAEAGEDLSMAAGSTARLNGRASMDPDGDPLTLTWSIIAAPQASRPQLLPAGAPDPMFSTDRDGTYEIQLVVHDGQTASVPDRIRILVEGSAGGWCCRDGEVFSAAEEQCWERGGGFFRLPEEAEEYCRNEQRPEAEGWCCRDGEVFRAPEGGCREHSGTFFYDPREAEESCRREERPQAGGWCCRDGEVFSAAEEECWEHGGGFFRLPEEAEEYCRNEQRPQAEGWCCRDGEVFRALEGGCREHSGTFFYDPREAEESCHREQRPQAEGWCCRDGEVFSAAEEECWERGGGFFRLPEEAEEYCRSEQRPQAEGWCCRDGEVFSATEDGCREHGGAFFYNPEEAEEHCQG